jgi:thiamine kinase-like enzyme
MLSKLAKELRRLHTVAKRNHGDLNFTNVLIDDGSDPLVLNMIDFEYASALDAPYDVANFFCEHMYDNASSDWYEPHTSLYPSDAQAREFVACYLDTTPEAPAVTSFLEEVRMRLPAVHRYWIDWALENFADEQDYVLFAERRRALLVELDGDAPEIDTHNVLL